MQKISHSGTLNRPSLSKFLARVAVAGSVNLLYRMSSRDELYFVVRHRWLNCSVTRVPSLADGRDDGGSCTDNAEKR